MDSSATAEPSYIVKIPPLSSMPFMRTMQEGVQQAMEKINQSVDSKKVMALNKVNEKINKISQRSADPTRSNASTRCSVISPELWAGRRESLPAIIPADLHWLGSDEERDQPKPGLLAFQSSSNKFLASLPSQEGGMGKVPTMPQGGCSVQGIRIQILIQH